MSFYITCDATCDLPERLYPKDFRVIPMSYTIGEEVYDGDEKALTPKEFYDTIRAGAMPTTSLINEYTATGFFRPLLEAGHDVLHIAFSSGLSGSCANLIAAAEALQKEFPKRKIKAIDSFAAAQGEGLLCLYASAKRDSGAGFEEVAEYVENLRDKLCHFVTTDDLFHLHRGGRVSKTAAVLGTTLNLKPMIHVSYEGKLIPFAKVGGRKKALNKLVDIMEEKMAPAEEQLKVLIGHSDVEEDAQLVAKKVTERFGITDIDISYLGPVIGSHTGIGTIALFFLGKEKI